MTKPKVSVVCWAYNQKDFIAQTIESFIMQKTDFEFEVIIHDDASTDGTTAIIKEYEKKYPNIVKPIYQKENQFSSGTSAFINLSLNAAKGTYIALCEGDDYWTDPNKLQLQADFLDSHADYALCFHPVHVVFENNEEENTIFPTETNGFTTRRLLNENFIQTNSVMYRRQKYENLPVDIMPRDWYLHLYHASFGGKIGFINKAMAVYRRHPGGVWWEQRNKPEQIWKKYGQNFLILLHHLMLLYGNDTENKKIIDNHIEGTVSAMSHLDVLEKTELIMSFAEKYPEQSKTILLSLSRSMYKNEKLLDTHKEVEDKLFEMTNKNKMLIEENQRLESQNKAILNSKSYKTGRLVTSPIRRARKVVKGGKNG